MPKPLWEFIPFLLKLQTIFTTSEILPAELFKNKVAQKTPIKAQSSTKHDRVKLKFRMQVS